MVILHRIPYPIAERVFFAIGEDELIPGRAGDELTIPVGEIRQGMVFHKAGVRVRFVLCQPHHERGELCPPACRAEILGQIIAVPMDRH